MTDKQTLFNYRLVQADETLADALNDNLSPRSVLNRAYYSTFYMILALYLRMDMNARTSKHIGVISLFDKEFIATKRVDEKYSKTVHYLFE